MGAREEMVGRVRQALQDAEAHGDPDDLDRYAEAVVDGLCSADQSLGGWLIRSYGDDRVYRVQEFDHNDGGYQAYIVDDEYEED